MPYAEDWNFFDTVVHPAKSQAEILEALEDFGAMNFQTMQGQVNGKTAWLIRFEWEGATYRFAFTPLECRYPNKERTFEGKKRSHTEQAKYQMGRRAVHLIKGLLSAAVESPAALFGFLELPEVANHPGGMPKTASEIDVSQLIRSLPDVSEGVFYIVSGEEK